MAAHPQLAEAEITNKTDKTKITNKTDKTKITKKNHQNTRTPSQMNAAQWDWVGSLGEE